MRTTLQNWPFPRGRGLLLRAFHPRLSGRRFDFHVGRHALVAGQLDDYMLLHHFAHRFSCTGAARLSRRVLRRGDTALDIGANVGLWTLLAAARVGETGLVHAFEPDPTVYERLCHHVALNSLGHRVKSHRLAIGSSAGEITFYRNTSGNSGLGGLTRRSVDQPAIPVRLTRLDDFIAEHEIGRVDFVKVDVEGGERQVFEGAERLLSRNEAPVVLFEAVESLARLFAGTTSDVKRLLAGHGYRCYRLDRHRLREVDVGQEHHEDVDLLALTRRHLDQFDLGRRIA